MSGKHDFDAFAHQKLDETLINMDGATRTRLAAIRRDAVSSHHARRGWMLPVSLATAMMALALIWMMPQQQNNNGVDVAAIEDMDLLASDIDMDLLEDVEFYQWLNDGDHAG